MTDGRGCTPWWDQTRQLSNLLVVLYGSQAPQPVVKAGSLYS